MYDHRTSNPFYSVSLETKLSALPDIIGMNIVDVLDDISDGAGGAESARFVGAESRWVTVLDSSDGRCTYVILVTHPDESSVIVRADTVSLAFAGIRGAEDSRNNLAAALNSCDSFAEMARLMAEGK